MGFNPLMDGGPAIDAGISIPDKRGGRGPLPRKYPWLEMKIGDSFLVQKAQHKFGNSVWNAEQRYGLKFCTRSVTVDGVKCVRVWRIA
jgi:hypothetical protein